MEEEEEEVVGKILILKNWLQSTTQDLFELLERVQSSRLDDQRCVLPSYFSQVCDTIFILCARNTRGKEILLQICERSIISDYMTHDVRGKSRNVLS